MAAEALIDTGAILAILDRNDRQHRACLEAYQEFRFPFLTSNAVLTELFHLLRPARIEMEAAWAFVESDAIELATITDAELPAIHALMSRYRDHPMDFADATLVYLARREGISTILTINRADFETYRIEGRRQFRIRPERYQ
jgi:uncharacterized protein